jgi:8-oxo-dGTP pyrophosphatase MutT (NUDIX family)
VTSTDSFTAADLLTLISDMSAWDDREQADLARIKEWAQSGAPLFRTVKPATPNPHLVSYFVVADGERVLLVAHRAAGLWLPTGGHVEPGEDPWAAARRECGEELGIEAVPHPVVGRRPLFATVTRTLGPDTHTDVSLWFVLTARAQDVTAWDHREFDAIRWVRLADLAGACSGPGACPGRVSGSDSGSGSDFGSDSDSGSDSGSEDPAMLDPRMPAFAAKLAAAVTTARRDPATA